MPMLCPTQKFACLISWYCGGKFLSHGLGNYERQGVDRNFDENSSVGSKDEDVCRHICGQDHNRMHCINYRSKAKYLWSVSSPRTLNLVEVNTLLQFRHLSSLKSRVWPLSTLRALWRQRHFVFHNCRRRNHGMGFPEWRDAQVC
jgi:hypothetical protein